MDTHVHELGRFIVGDDGYGALYSAAAPARRLGAASGCGARTMVRETAEGVRACIYYPDVLVRRLEEQPPQRSLSDHNIDAFSTLIEELDHLLLIAERTRLDRELSLFELELHANVSKELVVSRFAAGRKARLDDARRAWIRHHLFGKITFVDDDPAVRQRYRDATRWALRFLDGLRSLGFASRLRLLRHFHHATHVGKLRMIRDLPS